MVDVEEGVGTDDDAGADVDAGDADEGPAMLEEDEEWWWWW